MTVISNSIVAHCTPEQAFDYLSDHRNELDWNPGVEYVDKITEGPIGLGTGFRAKWREAPQPVVMRITSFDRPRSWVVHNGGLIEVLLTIRVEQVDAGTRVSMEFDAQPHGWMRLVFPLFLARLRKAEKANAHHIKTALERRAGMTTAGDRETDPRPPGRGVAAESD